MGWGEVKQSVRTDPCCQQEMLKSQARRGPHLGLVMRSNQRQGSERGLILSPQRVESVSKREAECHPFCVPQPPSRKPPRLRREQMPHLLQNEQLIDICPSIVFMVFLGCHLPPTPRSGEVESEMECE